MAEFKWRYIDELTRPCFINEDDKCVYAREHQPGGYEISESNQLIFNYKKPVKYRQSVHYHYKVESIFRFAYEISLLKIPENTICIPVPSSKTVSDPEHDDRLMRTLHRYKQYNPDVQIFDIIRAKRNIPSAHLEDGPRNPRDIIPYLEIVKPPEIENQYVFILDDVVTTGGHFKACQTLLKEQYPNIEIHGLFWALHLFPEDE